MPAKLRNFEMMWSAYPAPGGSADEAKRLIGGGAMADAIDNTCVLRLSRSFNASGNPIPGRAGDEIATVRGADGLHYAFRVREFTRYLRRKYGRPDVEHHYERDSSEWPDIGLNVPPPELIGKQGVIVFEVSGWEDATGHADLFNGIKCRHHGYFHRADTVMLWIVDDEPRERLSGSVGRGGRNAAADVERVQNLLADHGLDPGPIDGLVGPRTIAAIEEFQRRFLGAPDGRVDVGGRTWTELVGH